LLWQGHVQKKYLQLQPRVDRDDLQYTRVSNLRQHGRLCYLDRPVIFFLPNKNETRSAYHFFTVSKRAIMLNPNLQVGFRTNVASDSKLYLYMLPDQSSKISQIPCGADYDKHLSLKNYHKEIIITPLVVFFPPKNSLGD
jgi:hypothetical protein